MYMYMEDWDQETLEKVIESKRTDYQQNKPTDILGDNFYEGSIPHSLGNLQYISKALNISNNRLSSEIPSSLGNLQEPEVLDLSKNSLYSPIPSQLSNMISLSVVKRVVQSAIW